MSQYGKKRIQIFLNIKEVTFDERYINYDIFCISNERYIIMIYYVYPMKGILIMIYSVYPMHTINTFICKFLTNVYIAYIIMLNKAIYLDHGF